MNGAFKRAPAQEIFARDALQPEHALSCVEYPDGSGGCIYIGNEEDIAGMMFNHCGGETFFDRVWELEDRTDSHFFWPGFEQNYAVRRPERAEGVEKWSEGNFLNPQVARNGLELVYAINSTT